ncbi:hypothetical protein F5Y19DRAFT_484963 [Xylariaceae sp. FL1651]|nr:hypothetical protein F5Y19DRAFT_484963 [Xylariaceae sp. FL1651]
MYTDSDDEYRLSSSGEESDESEGQSSQNDLSVREVRTTGQKRRRQSFSTPTGPPPLKRVRGSFNVGYLNLLNKDIQDASVGLIHDNDNATLEHTQIGAVAWTAAEKEAFFAAVSRLGQDDLAGVASRIGTKSELEVRQYLMLLDAAERRRRADESKRQRALRPVDIPAAVEISAECSAALEDAADGLSLRQESYEEGLEKKRWGSRWLITAPLAQVLEYRFRSRQQPRPSPQPPQLQQQQGEQQEGRAKTTDDLPFLQLFLIRNWLRLSDRVFMNSGIPDGNWRAVSEEHEPPAIRATAFADFHALALSITRRLVSAALYVAESRIRAKHLGDPRRRVRRLVRHQDVKAAVVSIGMKENSRLFWARSARRLRLDVFNDEAEVDNFSDAPDAEVTDTDGGEHMDHEELSKMARARVRTNPNDSDEEDYKSLTFDEVEAALGFPTAGDKQSQSATDEENHKDVISTTSESELDEEQAQQDEEDITMKDQGNTAGNESENNLDSDAIAQDLEEAITYSATLDYAGTTRARQALQSRIRAEHMLERDAECLDIQTSADAEKELWAMLRNETGDSDLKTKDSKAKANTSKTSEAKSKAGKGKEGRERRKGDDDEDMDEVEEFDGEAEELKTRVRKGGLVDLAPKWRDNFKYYSEWEAMGVAK